MFAASARRRAASLPVILIPALLLAGCSGSGQARPEPASPTPLSRLDTSSMRVPRIDFCSLVPRRAVRDALGAAPRDATTWGNGEVAAVGAGTRDVVDELGCEWRASDGTTARAWIFAQPVTAAFARVVAAASARERGCRSLPGPAFGERSVTQVCRTGGTAGAVRRRHAGLFGQSWLSCEVAASPQDRDLARRADAWCAQVLGTLDALGTG